MLAEHLSALAAILVSTQPATKKQAIVFEDALVKRVFAMNEALFRQAITPAAAAFEPAVVRQYSTPSIELATLIQTLGGNNG